MEPKILITGANGQIGRILSEKLAKKYGSEQVVTTDLRENTDSELTFEHLDVTNYERLVKIVKEHRITHVYHLAALLSASGEKNVKLTWDVNFNGYINILDCALETGIERIFFPSSIAVYGTDFELNNTPQNAHRNPTTMYGISKVAGESWSYYYWKKHGLDIRSIRYPGIIGYQSMPGGGTTDYAVEIFHEALKTGKYNCFLSPQTTLPMIYMDDAIDATLELMAANPIELTIRNSYNLQGISFSPEELYKEILKHLPNFEISYQPDERQLIAESWPKSMDDSAARKDWAWEAKYDLAKLTETMITELKPIYNQENESYATSS